MKDTRELKHCFFFCILFVFLLILYFLLCVPFAKTPNYLTWVHGAYTVKENSLESAVLPKVVIVGGSNVHFGINAENFTMLTNTTTINYGLHAGLMSYHLERSKRFLQSGDVVIAPLEYEYYWHKDKFFFDDQPLYVRYILTYDSLYFDQLPLPKKATYILVSFMDLLGSVRSGFSPVSEMYDYKTINRYGDETMYGEPSAKLTQTVFPESIDFSLDGPMSILSYKQWCELHNVTFYVSFPSTFFESTPSQIASIVSFLEEHNISMLGTPSDFIYPRSYFYDTQYHLNKTTREIRTSTLADLYMESLS